ncbi:hypothetical protein CEUSTIGMA_g7546.t1 [Chlamydomonas eustigma]|uniref:Uncharacterized protein n=1 Tax=Chlamydomonas eustigma TaxID=1157962 RepID=A0A250XAK2_9CHLO|nr:hypothetical protein CEUSTIGMA_g7546.t1 [Chlamydomonas eustigma]|eukprot:GAX80108.1 hypothetical protein CEUSTIGMA_g7546.t1 [Chlamydomonas eustigma]
MAPKSKREAAANNLVPDRGYDFNISLRDNADHIHKRKTTADYLFLANDDRSEVSISRRSKHHNLKRGLSFVNTIVLPDQPSLCTSLPGLASSGICTAVPGGELPWLKKGVVSSELAPSPTLDAIKTRSAELMQILHNQIKFDVEDKTSKAYSKQVVTKAKKHMEVINSGLKSCVNLQEQARQNHDNVLDGLKGMIASMGAAMKDHDMEISGMLSRVQNNAKDELLKIRSKYARMK